MFAQNTFPEDESAGTPADNPQADAPHHPVPAGGTLASDANAVPPAAAPRDAENPSKVEKNAGPAEPAGGGPSAGCSEAVRRRNRKNAQKSTGPRTARGKAFSRFNAVTHGLCAKRVMFAADGTPVEGLKELAEALDEKYGTGDVAGELRKEALLSDYWRVSKALEYETKFFAPDGSAFHSSGMPNLTRYLTANRKAFLRELEILEERQADADNDEAEDEEAADEEAADEEAGGEPAPEPDASLDQPSGGAAAARPEDAEAV